MPSCLDLYAGLGGASEAMVDARWEVIRVENNPALSDVPHTKIADASWAYGLLSHEKFDLVWASPTTFSMTQNRGLSHLMMCHAFSTWARSGE